MTDGETDNNHREPTPAETKAVILALIGFFSIVLAVALVPSFLKREKESQDHYHPLPPAVECVRSSSTDNLRHCEKAMEFEKACRSGDAKACWHVGGFYLEDDNLEFNRQTGIKWLDHSCHMGHVEACAWLDDLLENQVSP